MRRIHKEIHTKAYDREFIFKNYIQANIEGVPAKYTYPEEKGINPAFQRVEEVDSLEKDEKRIFALRSDFILATGVKNAEHELGYEGLRETFDEANYPYINWKDRYGHPSLAIKDERYDGTVLYAGFICQREGYLQIFLSSGRYNRYDRKSEGISPLTIEQIFITEAYLSLKFQKAYGVQTVVFYDTTPEEDAADSAIFFTNKTFPEKKKTRVYDEKSITNAAKIAYRDTHFEQAQRYIREAIPPVKPRYHYEVESRINPGYQDIYSVTNALRPNEKKIWALRSDFILAIGVINAYEKEYGYTGFQEAFSKKVYSYINWEDRYGHTSLTTPDGDGLAYYAGYLCQKKGFLQVYLVSGRYERKDLCEQQIQIMEAYIAAQLQVAYGNQDIEFVTGDSDIPSYHATFFSDSPFAECIPKRRYSRESIKAILSKIPKINTMAVIGKMEEQPRICS